MRGRFSILGATIIAGALALVAACSSGSTTTPSPGTGPVGATITITTSGVSPKNVTVNSGEVVTVLNSDPSRSYEIASDPHPQHNTCPAINALGVLSPGQSRNTGDLTISRACGFHDHRDASNTSLQGTITVR